jgi:Hint domain
MVNMDNPIGGTRRSRRNLIKIGAIAASAILAGLTKTTSASAGPPPQPGGSNGPNHSKNGSNHPNCFLKGTRIRTVTGDKKIEDLASGDLLPGLFGGICPIQWIGRYSFKKSDPTKAWVRDVLPVRVARSAIAPEVPDADLCITREHALLIDGVLVPVHNLMNGSTIAICDRSDLDELEYFHIKLERHDVIYAEGAPCETLLYVDERAVNFAEYLRQYGPPPTRVSRCAPPLGLGSRRIEIKSRLRSAISPWMDCRNKGDVMRDELEEGGSILPRYSELCLM